MPWDLLSRIIGNTGAVQPVEEVGPEILDLLTQENPAAAFRQAVTAPARDYTLKVVLGD
jgi:hypothetical protein